MYHVNQLNDKWIKASILGTIWASSEIVLGSFLHNLRVPFSGNILTAIGIVILISAHYKWKESGLFWRAGLVCALLKTMSPSAVIFGPMVAIFSEALLLEFSTRIFGRNIAGFVLGSVLAMSWNLFQKIFNFIIFYGFNIVEVYKNLMKFAEKQLGLQFDAVWAPLLILLSLYAVFGAFAALIGIRTGKKIKQNPIPLSIIRNEKNPASSTQKIKNFNYSLAWLNANIILVFSSLFLINRINFWFWVVLVLLVIAIWAVRYKRALRQLVRPKLWIFFILITMLTAFAFTRLQPNSKSLYDAVLIGIEMNLRAIVLIMGFTVLGTELYHPKIRSYFSGSRFKHLPLAIELSVESLPVMIANTPDFKTIVKNPLLFVQQIMTFADFRLKELKNPNPFRFKTFILTGDIGCGKTTVLKEIIAELEKNGQRIAGFYSKRKIENKTTTGYNLVDVASHKTTEFLSITGNQELEKVGKFFINKVALQFGENIFKNITTEIVVIDEIGKLELNGRGWANSLQKLYENQKNHFILIFRNEILNDLLLKFQIEEPIIYDLNNKSSDFIKNKIVDNILLN